MGIGFFGCVDFSEEAAEGLPNEVGGGEQPLVHVGVNSPSTCEPRAFGEARGAGSTGWLEASEGVIRMVEAFLRRGGLSMTWRTVAVVTIGLASVGCTMCPDPFDYSGPVPNGSTPQNDFRARSNGILPLGAAPKPWPLLVDDGHGASEIPEADEPTNVIAAGGYDEDVGLQQPRPMAAEPKDSETADVTSGLEHEEADATDIQQADRLDPVPASAQWRAKPRNPAEDVVSARVERTTPEDEPQDQRDGAVPSPVSSGETPGWRTSRR